MSQKNDDLKAKIENIFTQPYEKEYGHTIPASENIPLHSNYGVRINMATLFIDLRDSTSMVRALGAANAARMYKSFLLGVSTITKQNDGEVLSFNGDGVLVGFAKIGKEEHAVVAGLQMSHFLQETLGPKMKKIFDPAKHTNFRFGIGVTSGEVLVIKGGIRGTENSDLVWVGDSVNTAVKISSHSKSPLAPVLNETYIFISQEVFDQLPQALKTKSTTSGVFPGLMSASSSYWTQKLSAVPSNNSIFSTQNRTYTTKYYIEPGTLIMIEKTLGTISGLLSK